VLSNIHAVHELTEIVRTSLGPNGRLKLVVNHLGKQALTNNSSTILKEIDVVHPAAKLLVMASQQQEAELGDATNLVVVFGGELLTLAEHLLRMGLHPPDIIAGYELGRDYALKALEGISSYGEGDIES
jgi:T-complex protein 1 subunit theta